MPKRRNHMARKILKFFKIAFLIFPFLVIEFIFAVLPRAGAWEPVFWDWSRATIFAVNSFIAVTLAALLIYFEIITVPANFFSIMTEHWYNGWVLAFWFMMAIPVIGCLVGIVQIVQWLVSKRHPRVRNKNI